MSVERDVVDTKSGGVIALDLTKSKEEIKALMIEILDRGITLDRLFVPIRDDLHGEWVPNYQNDINEYKLLGFEIADSTQHLEKDVEKIATDASGKEIIAGDTIYMVCSKIRKEAIDEIRHEKFIAMHGKKGDQVQLEEKEYVNNAKTLKKHHIGTIQESKTESISGTDVQQILTSMKRDKTGA